MIFIIFLLNKQRNRIELSPDGHDWWRSSLHNLDLAMAATPGTWWENTSCSWRKNLFKILFFFFEIFDQMIVPNFRTFFMYNFTLLWKMIAKILLRMIIRAGYEFYNIISLYSCIIWIYQIILYFTTQQLWMMLANFWKKKTRHYYIVAPPKEYNYERSTFVCFFSWRTYHDLQHCFIMFFFSCSYYLAFSNCLVTNFVHLPSCAFSDAQLIIIMSTHVWPN